MRLATLTGEHGAGGDIGATGHRTVPDDVVVSVGYRTTARRGCLVLPHNTSAVRCLAARQS